MARRTWAMNRGGIVVAEVANLRQVQERLEAISGPGAKKSLDEATKKAAGILARTTKKEAPQGATGLLKKSVRARKAKGGIGHIVSPRPKIAFYRHMVIRGTKAHGARPPNKVLIFPGRDGHNVITRRVEGVRPNDFVTRGYEAGKERAEAKVIEVLRKHVEGAING